MMLCMMKDVLQIDGSEFVCLHFQALIGQGLGGEIANTQTEEDVCLAQLIL